MAIKYGTIVLSALKFWGVNITQISFLGKLYKLVDDVKITFVEGSSRTTVSYPTGSTVNRSTAPSGATFVGWSTSSAGTSPVKTFTASTDITVYRVVKYSDKSGTVTSNYGVYISYPERYSKITFVMPESHNACIAYCAVNPPANTGIGELPSEYKATYLTIGDKTHQETTSISKVGYYLFWTNPTYSFSRNYAFTGKTMVG